MGIMGMPNGGSLFFAPEPARGIVFEDLALNVLRSLQFSYMLMKGLRSTTRALKDLDCFRDDGVTGGARGRHGWRPAKTVGSIGRIGTAGNGCNRLRVGRQSGGGCRSGVRNGRGGGAGRRAKCAGDNLADVARGEGGLDRKVGGIGGNQRECRGSQWTGGRNGAIARNGACKGSKAGAGGTNGGSNIEGNGRKAPPRGNEDGKFGELNIAGDSKNSGIREGVNEPFVREGSPASGMAIGDSKVPADSVVGSKLSDGVTNRTLSVAGLGAVDSISNQLRPMKGFMKSVKMATGVVSGVKTATGVIQKFQGPAGGVLIGFGAANGVVLGFETARMIVKAGKISKDFASVWKSTRTQMGVLSKVDSKVIGAKAGRETLLKGLKASDGALSLVKLMKEFGGGLAEGFTNWDMFTKSYDASNSVLKVVEAVLGLKGGGMIGLVGNGFTALKGAVGGWGLSVKLVKAVVVSKEVSVLLLKGFGVSKTAMEAFKASQEGRRMVKWLIFRNGSKDPAAEDLLNRKSMLSLKGRADARKFQLLMTDAQQSAPGGVQGTSPSLMYSLASLLLARVEIFDSVGPDEDGVTSSSMSTLSIFSLSLPSWPDSEHHWRGSYTDIL